MWKPNAHVHNFKKIQSQNDNMKCVICLENLNMKTTPTFVCGHIYHIHCISKWFSYAKIKICPLCKKCIIHKDVHECRMLPQETCNEWSNTTPIAYKIPAFNTYGV